MTLAVPGAVMGRPSATRLSDRLDRAQLRVAVLSDELTALHAERASLARDLEAMSRALQLAVRGDRPDITAHVAGRLDALAASLIRRGAA